MPKSQFPCPVVLVEDWTAALPGAALMPLFSGTAFSTLLKEASDFSDQVILCASSDGLRAAAGNCGISAPEIPAVLLDHGASLGSKVRFVVQNLQPKFVCVVSLGYPFVVADDFHKAIAGVAYKGYSSVVGVTPNQFSVMKQLRKGRKGFFHEDHAVREVYALLGSPIVTQYEYLSATGNLISQKSGVLCLPQERSLRIKNGWDYIAAQAYSAQFSKLPPRPSELRSK